MLLHSDPRLAEVGDLSREQQDALARSVELRRQQLERDISDYIKQRQDELRTYEQEVR
jgi:tRNA A37 threonylcarbamoyladenosine dehydratase